MADRHSHGEPVGLLAFLVGGAAVLALALAAFMLLSDGGPGPTSPAAPSQMQGAR